MGTRRTKVRRAAPQGRLFVSGAARNSFDSQLCQRARAVLSPPAMSADRHDEATAAPPVPASAGNIARAAEILRRGGLVAFPTETVYGLGADATDDRAVAAIFEAKGRPKFNPLIVHVPDAAAAFELGVATDTARKLAAAFWPGPLTLVMQRVPACPVSLLASAGPRQPGGARAPAPNSPGAVARRRPAPRSALGQPFGQGQPNHGAACCRESRRPGRIDPRRRRLPGGHRVRRWWMCPARRLYCCAMAA